MMLTRPGMCASKTAQTQKAAKLNKHYDLFVANDSQTCQAIHVVGKVRVITVWQ